MNKDHELPMILPPLTERQQKVLIAVHGFVLNKRFYPAHRELAKEVGLTIPGVRIHVDALVKKGYLSRKEGQWRNLILEKPALEFLAGLTVPSLGIAEQGVENGLELTV